MGELLLATIMIACGSVAIFGAVRHNRYLVSHDEPGSLMFFLFGRTGLRILWILFGAFLVVAGFLVAAQVVPGA